MIQVIALNRSNLYWKNTMPERLGVVRWKEDKTLDLDRLLLPIYDLNKNIVAWCLSLPFLRAAEITGF